MRIVHFVSYFVRNSGYQEPYLARYQADLGHDVHVVTANRAYPRGRIYAAFSEIHPMRELPVASVEVENYHVHYLPTRLELSMQIVITGLLRKIDEISPDLVIAHGLTRLETLRIALWKRVTGQPFRLVVDDHMINTAYTPTWWRRGYYGLVNLLLHRAELLEAIDHVVPVSQETNDFVVEHFRIPTDKLTVIPLGAECDLFAFDSKARDELRRELGIAPESTVILYPGKLVRERGIDLLYEACRDELAGRDELRLLLVGSGGDEPFARQIRDTARRDGVGEKIIWCRHVPHDHLPRYYSAADLAVWPLQETMAAIEAASASLPLVLRDFPISRERTAGGNGFNCANLEEIREAVGALVRDEQLRRSMGQRGARFIRENYDWRVLARRFIEVTQDSN